MDGSQNVAHAGITSIETGGGADHFDVVVVGAGISGIDAAYHLQKHCPGKSYVILEGRENIGGTWDLFRYPGVRSDSDMHTLGFGFRPWKEAEAIADGPSIIRYLKAAIEDYGIKDKIRFQHRVRRASWSSEDALWSVEAERGDTGETVRFTCNFLFMCSGYYNYDQGYLPDFPGMDRFQGQLIHPQFWPDDLDYADKRVVVIGSGATAVTIVPAMAEKAGHVVMLQRSPTYMVSRPAKDAIANFLRRVLPDRLAYAITRWKNVLLQMFFFNRARTRPEEIKTKIIELVEEELGPDYDIETHFTPRYNPWDQRLCLVPDNDFFDALNNGSSSIVTDEIETFTEKGLLLKSGQELEADIIVTATGLDLIVAGGVETFVDGAQIDFSKTFVYKGMMYSGVPNMAFSFGYTNASWTLRADLTCSYVCRLINHMDKTGTRQCMPVLEDPNMEPDDLLDFSSGYVRRAVERLPKQGPEEPWRQHQNYVLDLMALRYGKVDDGTITFTAPEPAQAEKLPAAAI